MQITVGNSATPTVSANGATAWKVATIIQLFTTRMK